MSPNSMQIRPPWQAYRIGLASQVRATTTGIDVLVAPVPHDVAEAIAAAVNGLAIDAARSPEAIGAAIRRAGRR